jgi:hypothetical protein
MPEVAAEFAIVLPPLSFGCTHNTNFAELIRQIIYQGQSSY